MIEFCLLLPWYIFLFVGAFDFGFYSYALIATQNAARVGATHCATAATDTDQAGACTYAVGQLKFLPNVSANDTTCAASPITVTATYSASGADGNPSTTVTVIYVTPQLIPIPGVVPGQLTITRSVQMRLTS